MSKIRWGILGTGAIARKFAEGLQAVSDAELVAVGSRSQGTADSFGDEYKVPRRHASYEALAADDGVDAIYVATPHPMHKDNSILCLRAGRAVLCEKPFTVNEAEAQELVDLARAEKRFLMEAMWTRFIPVIAEVRKWIADGAIGEVRMLQADFGFRTDYDETSRLLDPSLAGGSLLDVGIYPISFASMIFGRQPETLMGLAHLSNTGVDEQSAYLFGYPGGALATLSSAVRTETPQAAAIMGESGMIQIAAPFWNAEKATLIREGKENIVAQPPRIGNGYNYEAAAVNECLRKGQLEHPLMPLDESIALMNTMDALRTNWGIRYPME